VGGASDHVTNGSIWDWEKHKFDLYKLASKRYLPPHCFF